MREQFRVDVLREAQRPRRPRRRLKPWVPAAVLSIAIGFVGFFTSPRPGVGLLFIWFGVLVLVLGAGIEEGVDR